MPVFAAFLYNVFVAFCGWLAKYFAHKVAFTVAGVSILTALIAGLYVAARALIAGALGAAGSVSPMFGAGVAMVISPHAASLLSGYLTFWSATELYKWKVNLLQLWFRTI
jgi:hypothetical protein